jgi:hypothetical protein
MLRVEWKRTVACTTHFRGPIWSFAGKLVGKAVPLLRALGSASGTHSSTTLSEDPILL